MGKEENLRKMLEEAAPNAVRLLIDVMDDEETDRKLRVDIAKELLSRVYGRGAVSSDTADSQVAFVLEGELENFAQ